MADKIGPPKGLKLVFSKAADYNRIDSLFNPAAKQKTDPKGYVVRRVESCFRKAVNENAAAMLSDEKKNVRGLTVAYRTHENKNPAPDTQHDYTEIGSSMTTLPGYNSTQLIIAALAIREWLMHAPKFLLVTDINKDNAASLKTYHDTLGWQVLSDPLLRAHAASVTDKTLDDAQNKSTVAAAEETVGGAQTVWHVCTHTTLATQAKILLAFMDAGGITNKKTGDFIPVDFNALEKEGVTRKALESLASGKKPSSLRPAA